jgi:hypothetical protein
MRRRREKNSSMKMIIALLAPTLLLSTSIALAQFRATPEPNTSQNAMQLRFSQLPKVIRDHAIEVRKLCNEANPEMTFDDMQGITIVDLKGDGSRDIAVDNETLCGAHMAGFNCSNRGCDMMIYKEILKGQWRKNFEEHLYEKHLAIDWDTMRLQLMVASIYAGDPRCKPAPNKLYTSGKSCNLIVTFRNDRWNWQLIK